LLELRREVDDMKNLWRVLCLALFVTGVVSFSQTQVRDKEENDVVEPALPFLVITTHYRISPDGTKSDLGERIRYVKANGEWRQSRYDSSKAETEINKESPVFANTDEGVFAKAPGIDERKFVSSPADRQMQECFRSHRCLRKQLSFVRTDEVAGQKVYVLRTDVTDPASPIEWVEQSYSPKTGYIALRNVKRFRDGSQVIMEAAKVEFKDVPENLNDDIKSLPTKKEG
jgi:hypothetical protein